MPARLTLEEARRVARERGGECLSAIYVNNRTPMHWQCANGHEWMASRNHILCKNIWCPYCAGTRSIDPLSDARRIARKYGGDCLSTVYRNNKQKLQWLCAKGHVWAAPMIQVRFRRTWCPRCKQEAYNGEARAQYEAIKLAEAERKCAQQQREAEEIASWILTETESAQS